MSALPPLERLAGRIGAATALAPERRRASHENYALHLLYGDAGGRFSILSIVWDHGRMSPIHPRQPDIRLT